MVPTSSARSSGWRYNRTETRCGSVALILRTVPLLHGRLLAGEPLRRLRLRRIGLRAHGGLGALGHQHGALPLGEGARADGRLERLRRLLPMLRLLRLLRLLLRLLRLLAVE